MYRNNFLATVVSLTILSVTIVSTLEAEDNWRVVSDQLKFVSCMAEDRNGNFWIGTNDPEGGTLNFYDGLVTTHISGVETLHTPNTTRVWRMIKIAKDGTVWAVARVGWKEGRLKDILYQFDGIDWKAHYLPQLISIYGLEESSDSKIWVTGEPKRDAGSELISGPWLWMIAPTGVGSPRQNILNDQLSEAGASAVGLGNTVGEELISGPWLWMVVPTEPGKGGAQSNDIDQLTAVSDGTVSEISVAVDGVNPGDEFNGFKWSLVELPSDNGNNVNQVVNQLDFAGGNVNDHSAYAFLRVDSPREQKKVLMRVGSDDSIKVWLNGQVVHSNAINRGTTGYQDYFFVDLKSGPNLLFAKVSQGGGGWGFFATINADFTAAGKQYTASADLLLAITEDKIATDGVREGDVVNGLPYQWSLAELPLDGDLHAVVNQLGFAEENVDDHSAYAFLRIDSPREQKKVLMRVGSDDSIKVWLNGQVVHSNAINRGATGYQDYFFVDLNKGENSLLVKVVNGKLDWKLFATLEADFTANGQQYERFSQKNRHSGLLNYDGVKWQNFSPLSQDPKILEFTNHGLTQAPDQSLWFSSSYYSAGETKQYLLWSYLGGEIAQFEAPDQFFQLSVLPSIENTIWCLKQTLGAESSDGKIWQFAPHQKQWVEPNLPVGLDFIDHRSIAGHVSQGRVALQGDQAGNILFGSAQGLFRYRSGQWEQLHDKEIMRYILTSDSRVFAAIRTIPREDQEQVMSYRSNAWQSSAGGVKTNFFYESSDKTIWLSERGGGGLSNLPKDKVVFSSFQGAIASILVTKNNGVWAGIGWWSGKSSTVLRLINGTFTDDPTFPRHQWSQVIIEDSHSNIWAAGWQTPPSYFDGSKWIQPLDENLAGGVEKIIEASDGTVWVIGHGIFQYDGQHWKTHFPKQEGVFIDILEDSSGRIWVTRDNAKPTGTPGKVSGSGVKCYDGSQWIDYDFATLYSNNFRKILESSDGAIWVGGSSGLYRFDGTNWQFQAPIYVSDMIEASDQTIWIASGDVLQSGPNNDDIQDPIKKVNPNSGGIYHFDGKEFIKHPSPGTTVRVLKSSDDTLWFATKHYGARRIFSDGTWSDFSTQDGLPHNFVNVLTEDADGNVWIGTWGGVAVSYPTRHPPAIRLVSINKTPIEDIKTRNIEGQETLLVGKSTVSFKWEAGDLQTDLARLEYQWKMDDGSWQISEYDFVTINIEDGRHTLSVRAINERRNASRLASFQIAVDTVRPALSIFRPADQSVISGEVDVIGSVIDNDLANFNTGYRPVGADLIQPISRSELAVSSDSLGVWDTRQLADGDYELLVRATDKLDHSRIYSIKVRVDNTAPQVTLQVVGDDEVQAGTISFKGQVSDPHLDNYQLQWTQDLSLTAETEWQTINSQEVKGTTYALEQDWDSSAVFGATTLRLLVQDTAGNSSQAQSVIDLNNLSAKPMVQITYPTAEAVLAGLVRIQGTASDPTLTSYTIEVASDQKPTAWTTIASQGASVNFGELGAWDTTSALDGDYRLQLSGLDNNGYQSQLLLSVQVDNTQPIAIIQRPELMVGGHWIASGTIAIQGTASDQNLKSYQLEYGSGLNPAAWKSVAGVSRDPVQDARLQEWDTSRLADGEYTLRLTVTDQASLSSESRLKLILDNQQAGAELMAPSQDQYVKDQIAIIGTANDQNFKSYRLELGVSHNPASWKVLTQSSTIRQAEGLYNWDTTGLEGQYSLKLIVEDFTNDQVVVQRQITVDNTPPQAQITVPEAEAVVSGNLRIVGTASDD
ncbi:MAG: two-component regulator propeller domain-containing protein, partial [Candidatus Poribacteria bacterium]|nr:two-component regulator propeller domain-containing protein [Candidatus Poribacteria bacterium]